MKFAKELEQDAVPEWRVKYLNYKGGKKHIKAVTRAIQRASGTPTILNRRDSYLESVRGSISAHHTNSSHVSLASVPEGGPPRSGPASGVRRANARVETNELSGLAQSPGSGVHYGSIVPPGSSHASDRYDFALPAPAIKVPSRTDDGRRSAERPEPRRSASMLPALPTGNGTPSSFALPPASSPASPSTHRQRLGRIFSTGSALARQTSSRADIGLHNLDQVRVTEREFFHFLDAELDKIESFYKDKEDQATERLQALREQLHEMRNRRIAEIAEAKKVREQEETNKGSNVHGGEATQDNSLDWIKSRLVKPGPNSKALQRMDRTPVMVGQSQDERRDYVRKPPSDDVPYRSAKRKLKLALQEFYRGLELLKSYALLNRTAFRKLNKKYDKAVKARPPYRYMNEKVNKAWFVNSDVLDGHIRTVEDLYARYFEKGNHKVAAGKLRNLNRRPGDSSGSAFRSGVFLGCGAVFGIQGLVYGATLLFDEDLELAEQASYLLQLYGGYFLILLLFSLFTLDCWVWTRNKINYPFIFELDTRHNLDWKQMAEFPTFFFALFGVLLWVNFSMFGDWEEMFLYWPAILIGISLIILFFPAPIFQHKARRWFLYSHYRLFWAGLYPVEFRDFFLGDIWCSLTYATCNVELFFCLYAREWDEPVQCNSNHSRLMGFLAALPPIWRALQCLRRYRDTKNIFPHLVNCGKYFMSIMAAALLSVYRIDGTKANLSAFIAFAAINAVYCSVWDLFMDFSLLQRQARAPLLREITGLKSAWVYYVIMVVDPLLRFSWIFYAIFTHNTQHSTVVSFACSLAEVCRRGMWALLRVENEHCGNVAVYKASRDTPLPYHLEMATESSEEGELETPAAVEEARRESASLAGTVRRHSSARIPTAAGTATGVSGGGGSPPGGTMTLRKRSDTAGRRSILQAMAEAHRQDFEKKKPTAGEAAMAEARDEDERCCEMEEEEEDGGVSDEDGSEDEETESAEEERMRVREAEGLVKGRRD